MVLGRTADATDVGVPRSLEIKVELLTFGAGVCVSSKLIESVIRISGVKCELGI